jgi:hypothetical protein
MLIETTRYELPPEGITLLGYIVRRMHKTEWLAKVSSLLAQGHTAQALDHAAIYAATASTSFGRAYYQPNFNSTGESITEADPTTGAIVTARLESRSPHYHISYEAMMPNGDIFQGSETITGTTVGLRGLGMPAPSKFTFTSGDYSAEFSGIITSELALSLFSNTRIRGYGYLDLQDNAGNTGRLDLSRSGDITIRVNDHPVTRHAIVKITWLEIKSAISQPVTASR